MIKLELVFSVLVFVVWVYTLIEVLSTPGTTMRMLPKPAWVVVVLLFPLLGSAAWFVLGRPEGRRPTGAYERSAPAYPEYDRPGRAAATDPERDEEFLRQVRARAEEQRKRHELERRRREAGEA
ncbi:PLDc N-terminal domain-containing protein [Nocardioides flavescens]|uniref:PLDc N-terminal domain-containing protein n=1 Tax=Nocardioides flavescens TaxID=2691959 RepID=UPI00301B8536